MCGLLWKQNYMTCCHRLKVKLSPKCNLGSFCEWIWVKCLFKSIITRKETLLRFTIFLLLGQNHFQWSVIFKTLRRLDTTWNFARSITRVPTHEHEHWEHCLSTQSLLKNKVFEQLAVLISECNSTWRTVKVELYCLPPTTIHVRSHVTFLVILFFTNDKTMNYPCIYMELSCRSIPP